MSEREILQERTRVRLEIWERKIRRLFDAADYVAGVGTREVAQQLRELVDRRDATRNKLEKMLRASPSRFHEARQELEQTFTRLREAWDRSVAKLAWTDSARQHNAT